MAISRVTGIPESNMLTIAILVIICVIYTITVYFGMKGIAKLAASCTWLFFGLLLYVLIGGGEARYTIETGITAVGNMVQNFIGMSTWTDALRTSSFPQNWTIFYWAYWMVWCVATPFSSEPSARDAPSGRPFSEATSLDCPEPLLPLSSSAITAWRCRPRDIWTSWGSMPQPEICIRPYGCL